MRGETGHSTTGNQIITRFIGHQTVYILVLAPSLQSDPIVWPQHLQVDCVPALSPILFVFSLLLWISWFNRQGTRPG